MASTGPAAAEEPLVTKTELFLPKSAREGQSVTLKAQVSSNRGTLTGTVIFVDQDEKLGEAELNSLGEARLSLSTLKWGKHRITATYSGAPPSDSLTKVYKMRRSLKGRQQTWSAIQSGVTTFALLAATGWAIIWAVVTWRAQEQVRVRTEEDTHKALVEHERPVLQAKVYAQAEKRNNERLIRITVAVTNLGKKEEPIQMTNGPLFIASVEEIPAGAKIVSKLGETEAERGKVRFGEPKKFWRSQPLVDDLDRGDLPPEDLILPQETDEFQFLAKVDKPGLYAVMFSPGVSKEEQEYLEKKYPNKKYKDGTPYQWRWEPSPVFVEVK
jgi:hypothetical protein